MRTAFFFGSAIRVSLQQAELMPHSKAMVEFLKSAEAIWRDYLARGPGAVDSGLLAPLVSARSQLGDLDAGQAADAIRDVADLARRCVEQTQGLCFVSGEAGLIPRKDQHDRMEAGLATLRRMISESER